MLTAEKVTEVLSKFSFASADSPQQHTDDSSNDSEFIKGAVQTAQSSLHSALKSSMDSTQALATHNPASIPPLPPAAPESLCIPEVLAALGVEEKSFMESPDNQRDYEDYRFDMPCGSVGGGFFNDAKELHGTMVPEIWPRRLEIVLVSWGNGPIIGWLMVHYDQVRLTHGNDHGNAFGTLAINLNEGEYITRIKMSKGTHICGVEGVMFVEVGTSQGRVERVGSDRGLDTTECVPPQGFLGLKGFFGWQGEVIDRLGAIWGR